MTTPTWWLGFDCIKDRTEHNRYVKEFISRDEAEKYRNLPSSQREFSMPNRMTIPFEACTENEALEKMDRY